MPAAVVIVLLAGPAALMILTGIGARTRGVRWPTALIAGVFFPLTWVAWYVRDELPRAVRHG